jgi:hypothetical protein
MDARITDTINIPDRLQDCAWIIGRFTQECSPKRMQRCGETVITRAHMRVTHDESSTPQR